MSDGRNGLVADNMRADPKIDQAVAWLDELKSRMESELTLFARQIGDYLLEGFFENDLAQVTSQNPRKNISFKRLCERKDLPFSESALRRFIQVAVNFRLLPFEHASTLLPSHHSVLYQVADPQERCRIGVKAAEKGLSVRKLREQVKGKGRRRPGGGRKPESNFVKNWRHLVSVLETLSLDAQDLECLAECKHSEIKGDCRRIRDMLTQVIDKVDDISVLVEANMEDSSTDPDGSKDGQPEE